MLLALAPNRNHVAGDSDIQILRPHPRYHRFNHNGAGSLVDIYREPPVYRLFYRVWHRSRVLFGRCTATGGECARARLEVVKRVVVVGICAASQPTKEGFFFSRHEYKKRGI